MAEYATTKLSSRGQIVIPEEIRLSMRLKEGDQFVVIGQGDTVILKAITPPSMDEFPGLMKEAALQAKKVGMKQREVSAAIRRVRKK